MSDNSTTTVAVRDVARGMDLQSIGQVLVRSGFFHDTKDAAQAIVKVMAGAELGFGPIASMQGVYIVKGRVTLSANLVGAAIQRSGRYRYRVAQLDNERCDIVFYEGTEVLGRSSFTLDDAKAAGLLQEQPNYRKYPRNMLFSRALTNGARWYCPDIFNGPIYTPDELGAVVDMEGNVLEGAATTVQIVDTETGEITPQAHQSAEPEAAELVRCSAYERGKQCDVLIDPQGDYRADEGVMLGGAVVVSQGMAEFKRVFCLPHLRKARELRASKATAGGK